MSFRDQFVQFTVPSFKTIGGSRSVCFMMVPHIRGKCANVLNVGICELSCPTLVITSLFVDILAGST